MAMIDTPKSCIYCPFLRHRYTYGQFFCGYDDNERQVNSDWCAYERLDNCPLEETEEAKN